MAVLIGVLLAGVGVVYFKNARKKGNDKKVRNNNKSAFSSVFILSALFFTDDSVF